MKIGGDFMSEEELENEILDPSCRSHGFRLIDLENLSEAMTNLHMCKHGKSYSAIRLVVLW